jgi:hypothetical protein
MLTNTSSPLIIGVSGHRDMQIDQYEVVRSLVAGFFKHLVKLVPDTEIRVTVGMAEGADLLLAQLALEHNFVVDAVLPMPLADYAMDFDDVSLALLRELLAHPKVNRIELPPLPDQCDIEAEPPGIVDRDALYVQLSEYLLRRSSLMIALWDGVPSSLVGGTADTVLRYLSARSSASTDTAIEMVEDSPVTGSQFVYWVPVLRRQGAVRLAHAQPCYLSGLGENLLRRHAHMPPELEQQLEGLNHYNRVYKWLVTARPTPAESLLSTVPDLRLPERRSLEPLDAEYGKADALAVHYQKPSDRLFRFSSYMAALVALLFLVYAELSGSRVVLAAYLVTLLFGIGLYYGFADRHWFSNHLACRVLAETLRTKFFLRLAGVEPLVNASELIDLTGIDQFSGSSWIRSVLRSVDQCDTAGQAGDSESEARLAYVQREWIVGQHEYFRAKVARLERTNHRLEQTKKLLIYIMVLIAVALILYAKELHLETALFGAAVEHWLVFLMGLLPVWLGTWELYQHKMATRELLWQYRNQLNYFFRAREQLKRASSHERRIAILADLGKESLVESYLWMIHRYHREHEPPASG